MEETVLISDSPKENRKDNKTKADRRWKMVDRAMRKNGYEQHSLIEVLHVVQETFGYLENDALEYVSKALGVPLSQVYGVATFYHFFTLKPQGEHTCVLCTGTACYIKGVPELIDTLKDVADVTTGETTEDNKLSVLSARCVGACGLAPVAVLDGEVVGKLKPGQLRKKVEEWIA